MDRRRFSQVAAAWLGLPAAAASRAAGAQAAVKAGAPQSSAVPALGTNLSGMEWAGAVVRYGASTLPNLNFTVPRKADVIWLARNGYTRTRLPISWELLQPMLHDTKANAAAVAAIGRPGAFHAGYESYVTGVLDAHAAAGMKCIVDCHNSCRYLDFKFQEDGSVGGLVVPPNALVRPYTSDNKQVQTRIFALAPGATLTVAHFTDFWVRAANKWKNHPGFGGYGLMNEPHDMPRPGEIVGSSGGGEDLTIWPAYAQAAIKAIRAVDPVNPIYLGGNEWSAAMSIGKSNPGWPLAGDNIVYEVHMYLDAASTGKSFDFDTELARKTGDGPLDRDTGVKRLKPAVDWARAKGVRLALTEAGMPLDDPRWEEMFKRLVQYARQSGCEVYSWQGGNHWPFRNSAINHVPGWHQSKTLEPAMSGPMKSAWGIAGATLYDDGPGFSDGGPLTITVYARGNLSAPVKLAVASSNGGRLSHSQLEIPAGPNGQATFTFTPSPNAVTTLSYTSSAPGIAAPPARKVYSLANPVAYAGTNLSDAAMAILAKYGASKWDMADAYTDYLQGVPSGNGQPIRAVSDSGYGSGVGNAMEMLNWLNRDSDAMGTMAPPVMRIAQGRKSADHSGADTWGLWCRKTLGVAQVQPNPRNRIGWGMHDAHFAMACVNLPVAGSTGVVFQASNATEAYHAELGFSNGQPQARWLDAKGTKAELISPKKLEASQPAVLTMVSAPGGQALRVNSAAAGGSGSATFAPSGFDQLLIGWGFLNHYPRASFGGSIHAVIAGKGAPRPDELAVLERYLGALTGMSL